MVQMTLWRTVPVGRKCVVAMKRVLQLWTVDVDGQLMGGVPACETV